MKINCYRSVLRDKNKYRMLKIAQTVSATQEIYKQLLKIYDGFFLLFLSRSFSFLRASFFAVFIHFV